jgi:hypothetical protein
MQNTNTTRTPAFDVLWFPPSPFTSSSGEQPEIRCSGPIQYCGTVRESGRGVQRASNISYVHCRGSVHQTSLVERGIGYHAPSSAQSHTVLLPSADSGALHLFFTFQLAPGWILARLADGQFSRRRTPTLHLGGLLPGGCFDSLVKTA